MDLNTKWNDYPSYALYLWNGETVFMIAEGDGYNLFDEDVEAGYKDYWMTEYASKDEGNGGQWMETELISDLDYTIQGVIDRLCECDLWKDDWKIIDADLGEKLLDRFNKYHRLKREIKELEEQING